MLDDPFPTASFFGAFLLGLSGLFSIVNPIGSALLFADLTVGLARSERGVLCRRIAVNAGATLLGALLVGGYILAIFGVGLSALRIGGGLVVASQGWRLLMRSAVPTDRGSPMDEIDLRSAESAYFPLTMPLTVGPGSISVAIALSSQRPASGAELLTFFVGMSAAVVAISVMIWLAYRWSDRLVRMLGSTGAHVASRLIAFLLLCVGVQIIVTGAESLAGQVAIHLAH